MKIARTTSTPLALLLLVASASAQDFPGWGSLVDPVGNCPVDFIEGGLQLTIPGGVHQLNPIIGKVNAPRIWNEVEGDFLFEVRVLDFPRPELNSGANGNRSYLAAGIVLWQDDQNFLRWTRSASAEKNAVYLSCEQFENGKLAGGGNFPLKDAPIWLRIERRSDKLRMSASGNGTDWKQVIQRRSNYQQKLRLGVFGLNVTDREVPFQFQKAFLLANPAAN